MYVTEHRLRDFCVTAERTERKKIERDILVAAEYIERKRFGYL